MFIKGQFPQNQQLALMFQAVEAARNGVVITDPNLDDNPIVYANPAFTEITGYTADEILGRNCRFLQGHDSAQPAIDLVRQAIKEGRPITTVLVNYKKDGKRFSNELTISPVRDEHEKLIAFVGIQNDISARVEAEQRISDFYSVVSHELRTPISKIKSSLALIADGDAGPINESAKRFIDIALKSADSLWRLLENILDFKKMESGKFRLLRQRLNLAQLVESTVSDFQPVAAGAAMTIECHCTCKPDVSADGQRLVQVLENLLSNAVKFSPAGKKVVVRVLLTDRGWARVEVTDFGPGVAADDLHKLFDKFQQLDSPDSRARGGTGLGLAICKAIIEAHDGEVGASSELGTGSTFWFELEPCK